MHGKWRSFPNQSSKWAAVDTSWCECFRCYQDSHWLQTECPALHSVAWHGCLDICTCVLFVRYTFTSHDTYSWVKVSCASLSIVGYACVWVGKSLSHTYVCVSPNARRFFSGFWRIPLWVMSWKVDFFFVVRRPPHSRTPCQREPKKKTPRLIGFSSNLVCLITSIL